MILALDASQAAGPIGLLLVILIAVATVLLIRNMDRRIRRLPKEFPGDPRAVPRGEVGGGTVRGGEVGGGEQPAAPDRE